MNPALRRGLRAVNRLRLQLERRVYKRLVTLRVARYQEPLRVNGFTHLTRQTHLGSNTNFNGLVIQGRGTVTIGDNFHSGRECLLITENHNYDSGEAVPYDATYVLKDITIEDNVWLGTRVTVLGGVRLGEGAIVQAGAVVVTDVPPCAVAGGNPAKVFKYRDIRHYQTLKAQGKFF